MTVSNSITRFEGDYRFLSNFYECEILCDGFVFHSVEAAFQAMKCRTHEERIPFEELTAAQAKQAGRSVQLRPDWENRKLQLLYALVKQKFSANPFLREKLIATGKSKLLEGNRWHDNYWGSCDCPRCQGVPGQNHLGEILMRVRGELCYPPVGLISIKLPDGSTLEAFPEDETAYPSIDIWLVRPGGIKEKLCFAEYNPNRLEGLELCVAAYRHDDDEPSYYESYDGDGKEGDNG